MTKVRTIEGVGIGWKPELADDRDYIFEDRSADKMLTMEQLQAIRQHPDPNLLGPRRNQHAEGSCVGHGTSAAANRLARQDTDTRNNNAVYSPRSNYNWARILEAGKVDFSGEFPTVVDPGSALKEDNGAYVRDGVLALRKVGTCPESSWKYRAHIRAGDSAPGANDFKLVPSESRIKAARRFRVEAQRCNTVEGFLSALAAGYPVVYGTVCHTGLWRPEVDRTGVWGLPKKGDRNDGGHCMCAHWFDPTISVDEFSIVIFSENSWSDGYAPESPSGIAGCVTQPIEYIKRRLIDDSWAIVTEV